MDHPIHSHCMDLQALFLMVLDIYSSSIKESRGLWHRERTDSDAYSDVRDKAAQRRINSASPYGLSFDSHGNLFVYGCTNNRLQKFTLARNSCGELFAYVFSVRDFLLALRKTSIIRDFLALMKSFVSNQRLRMHSVLKRFYGCFTSPGLLLSR